MYQIKAQGGWEIQVVAKGENGLCRVLKDNVIRFQGTHDECVQWLANRGVHLL